MNIPTRVETSQPVFTYIGADSIQPPPILLGSFWQEALEQEIARHRGTVFEQILVEKFSPVPFTLALSGLRLIGEGEGERSRSEGSGALYLASFVCDNIGLLVQWLQPGVITSAHYHKQKRERFYQIAGESEAKLGSPAFRDGVKKLRIRGTLVVVEGCDHQLSTEGPALTLIEIEGLDPLGLSDYHPARLLG